MTQKVAVILSGCGHLDGAEIRESVLALLALDRAGAQVSVFAPDIPQRDVINHLTGEPAQESRNVLAEAARIARGQIKDLAQARAGDFDAVILPGGFGAAKNLSDLASKGPDASVLPELKRLLQAFLEQKKPIGAICIAPAVLAAALRDEASVTVTIGDDAGGLIGKLGGKHHSCQTTAIAVDSANHVVSCSAYMRNDSLSRIAEGIDKLVQEVLAQAGAKKKAA